ncbi:MAG: peptidoglycan DD-metalloendopeptidase family protein [Pseudomonadales bacterium]
MRQVNCGFTSFWRIVIILCFSLQIPQAFSADSSEKQLDTLKHRIGKLESWLNSAKGEQSNLQKELRASERKIGHIAGKLKALTKELKSTQTRIKKLRQQRQQLLAESNKQAAQIAEQIRAAYSIGHSEYLKVLLNLEQPAELARTLRYYDYFNRARAKQIEQYAKTVRQVEENETRINEQLLSLQRARQDLEQQHQSLKHNKQQRHTVLLRLQSDISNKGQQLGEMNSDRQRLEELLSSVEEAIADLDLPEATTPIKQLKGKLPWPTQGKIVRNFGSRDTSSGSRWNGVLIGAKEGNEVHAIHYGRVVFADWLRGFGLLLIIDHGNGYMSLYGHNQSLYKQTGDWVASNEVVSSVGNSGGKDNTGLYFEIRRNGKPQNPKSWILARK